MTSKNRALSRVTRGLKKVFGGGNPVTNAKNISSSLNLIEQYKKNGCVPWTPGYAKFKNLLMIETLADQKLMELFRRGQPLPAGYGRRLDERVVECPWAISKVQSGPGLLLDAGSVLNAPMFLGAPELSQQRIIIYSLEMDSVRLDPRLSYLHGDFRDPVLRDGIFDNIVCISTVEHIGMWPIPKPPYDVTLKQPQPEKDLLAYRGVMKTFHDLLKPGGRLLLTVPFGKAEDQDWLQVFGAEQIEGVKQSFGGECASETYYRHTADGWQTARSEECALLEYFNIVRTPEFGPDFAAAARAVACLELVRKA
ncbi:class I SAM-dependent methyltransferase [Accumulibacter sp.]|uniref:class I SAM-dependent methyltransferase n=2 Tax=unclassified Candidatus Accumulibacter TaxID=2619054 RepID=UPI001AC09C2F|nr:class I SAM-dependent methyltransferase [Accumulibacter sp.]MBN8514236.1 class I SAM-dependent methyltransferase [Accumulibacter sp.]HRI90184.1 class I SAM-dependent methyltransferase [Accumulibacter sp.]